MRARDLAEPYPTVTLDTDAMAAARAMGLARRPGLIVCDGRGRPTAVLPGSQVLRFVVPRYIQDDPGLARAVDEQAADELCRRLAGSTVRELLPPAKDVPDLPVVDGDATSLEVAAVMARLRSPVVAVIDDDDGDVGGRGAGSPENQGVQVIGAVTVGRLLEHLLPS